MSAKSFDAIVVGTGQAGPPLAVRMAKEGWKVAIMERHRFGGTCVNYGCIPTKTMVASARVAHLARRAGDFGVHFGESLGAEVRVNLAEVHARTRKIAGASEWGVEQWLRGAPGVEVLTGHASFVGPKRIRVLKDGAGDELEAPRIFLDVGGRPVIPDIPGLSGPEQVPFLTNTEMLELTELPEHLVILGGGYIALELGQMFRRFGSRVTVIENGRRLLGHEDMDIAIEVQRLLEREGVVFELGVRAEQVRRGESGVAVEVSGGKLVTGSHLLVATGRRPNTDDLALDRAGVKVDAKGYVEVDDQLRTSAEGVWALGDCNGKGAFTHTSYNDYEIAAANLFGPAPRRVSERVPTYALYVDPPLSRAGLNEAQVRARGKPALVAKMPMERVGRARERSETDGFLKAHVDAETKEILGAAFLGIRADEVIQLLLPLMTAKQPYTMVSRTVLIHPTVSELLPTLFEGLKPLI